MRIIATILLCILFSKCSVVKPVIVAPDVMTVQIITEKNTIEIYTIERSLNTINWEDILIVQADNKNLYEYEIPFVKGFYRLKTKEDNNIDYGKVVYIR